MLNIRKTIAGLAIFSLPLGSVFAQEEEDRLTFSAKGFVDTYHAVRAHDSCDLMSSRSRVRLEGRVARGGGSAFVSANATYNALLPEQTGVFLREAFVEGECKGWNFRLGRQIVTWGVADGLQLTDVVSPMDYTEFLAQDYDDIRVPVNAVRLCTVSEHFRSEVLWVPVPEFFVLPTDPGNPWNIKMNGLPCQFVEQRPSKLLENGDFGARLCFNYSGLDFSLAALRTFNKMPAFQVLGLTPEKQLLLAAEYRRLTMLGADFSFPLDKFVIRGEVAEYLGALQTCSVPGKAPLSRNQTQMLVGVDWYPGNYWTLMLQYNHSVVDNYSPTISAYRNQGMVVLNISKELCHNLLKLNTFGRIDCANNGGFFFRFNADYLLTDQLTLSAGYDWFRAESGTFSMYDSNDECYVKGKFSF